MEKYIPAICSFFIVGLGQIIKGNGKKGLGLLLSFYFAVPMLIYTVLIAGSGRNFLVVLGFSIFALFSLWLYSIIDAVKK